jgi:hypothetical protein
MSSRKLPPTISPRNHVHHFRLVTVEDVDDDFRSWVREAYAVGAQEHLARRRTAGPTV